MTEVPNKHQSISLKTIPIIIISGLLYLIGLDAIVIMYSFRTEKFNIEQIPFIVELKDSCTESDIFQLEQHISKSNYCVASSTQFISREEAVNKLISDELKKEEIEVFEENLLPNILEFQLKSNYISKESEIITALKKQSIVAEVYSSRNNFSNLNAKLQRIRLIATILLIFFIFVAASFIYQNNKQTLKTFIELQNEQKTSNYRGNLLKLHLRFTILCSMIAIILLCFSIFAFRNSLEYTYQYDVLSLCIISAIVFVVGFFLFAGSTQLIKNQINSK